MVSVSMTIAPFGNAVLVADQNQSNHNSSKRESSKGCQALRESQLGVIHLGQTIGRPNVQVHSSAKGQDEANHTILNLCRKNDSSSNEDAQATDEVGCQSLLGEATTIIQDCLWYLSRRIN